MERNTEKLKYYKEIRPWGSFEDLYEDENTKVKKLVVKANNKLSYQSHTKRAELWQVIKGSGILILNDKETKISKHSVCKIERGDKHRLVAGELGIEVIEIQTGESFEEEDIIRYKDDFGRV